jgi:hypothetical protein
MYWIPGPARTKFMAGGPERIPSLTEDSSVPAASNARIVHAGLVLMLITPVRVKAKEVSGMSK